MQPLEPTVIGSVYCKFMQDMGMHGLHGGLYAGLLDPQGLLLRVPHVVDAI